MKYKIIVITQIPKIKYLKDGNLYDDVLVKDKDKEGNVFYCPFNGVRKNSKKEFIEVKLPVFEKGEIIIVDETGREIGGARRKPSKWFVGYKEFKSLEEAIKSVKK